MVINKLHRHIGIFLSILSSLTVFGNDEVKFKSAEALFKRRGEGIEQIHEAKRIYIDLLTTSKNIFFKQISFDRIGRLSAYEGDVAKDQLHTKHSDKIFEECVQLSENISPKKIKKLVPEYIYWRAACRGLYLAHVNKATAIFNKDNYLEEIRNLIKIGQENFKNYDGYGFHRMEAKLYSESVWVGKIYNPSLALNIINQTIKEGGNNFYMNYIVKSKILKTQGNKKEAKMVLDNAINELDQRIKTNAISEDLLPENKIFLEQMRELNDKIDKKLFDIRKLF